VFSSYTFTVTLQAIVRIALRAFQNLSGVSAEDKVKGLLLNMWRYSQEMLGAHMQEYGTLRGGGFNTHKEELLRSVEVCSLHLVMRRCFLLVLSINRCEQASYVRILTCRA